jgi:hypothetical protein
MLTPAPIRNNLFGTVYSLVVDKAWKEYFARLDNQYEQVSRWTDPTHPDMGKVEPPTNVRRDGLLAYANGLVLGWQPNGVGAKGLWRWDSGSGLWVFVG